jgi:hypothetical protein
MRRPRALALLVAAAAAAGVLGAARVALAVCEEPDKDATLADGRLASTNLSPPSTHPTLGRTIVVANNQLNVLSVENLAALCAPLATGGRVNNSPTPVQLDDGTWAVFVATEGGKLIRYNPQTCVKNWETTFVSSTCTPALYAAPVVHLRRIGSEAFQAKYSSDVVYVASRLPSTGCTGPRTNNFVKAVSAADGKVLWSFTGSADMGAMDFVSEAGFLDLENDKLYVASEAGSTGLQSTLWAFDVVAPAVVWSTFVGGLQITPIAVEDRLYVATTGGEVIPVSKEDGAPFRAYDLGSPVYTNIFVERRDFFKKKVMVVDDSGRVSVLSDADEGMSLEWTRYPEEAGVVDQAVSRVAVDPNAGKLYVGGTKSKLYQMSLVDGVTETVRNLPSGGAVGDPSFFFDVQNGNDVRLIVGTETGGLYKLCSPWSTTPAPTGMAPYRSAEGCANDGDCPVGTTQCAKIACVDRVCTWRPFNDGGVCNDGSPYTLGDRCRAGTCTGISDCQRYPGKCTCFDRDNKIVERSFSAGRSKLLVSNKCAAIDASTAVGARARGAVVLHLLDNDGQPLRGATVKFDMNPYNASTTRWRHPITDALVTTNEYVSTTDGTIREGPRLGTYWGVFSGPTTGTAEQAITVTASVSAPVCVAGRTFQTSVRTSFQRGTISGTGVGGCRLSSVHGEKGYLKVKVLRGDNLEPAQKAWVMVGYAKNDQSFYSSYARFVDPGQLPPDLTNVKQTDPDGLVEFRDYGDNLNGPNTVTVGLEDQDDPDHTGYKNTFALVTMTGLARSDLQIVLPVAKRTWDDTVRWEKGSVLKPVTYSDGTELGLAAIAQGRDLGFFAGGDPAALHDVPICTANTSPRVLLGENVWVAPTRSGASDYEDWEKTFRARALDNVQTSYHRVKIADAFPNGRLDLRAYLDRADFRQIGFYLDARLEYDGVGLAPQLGRAAPATLTLTASHIPDKFDVIGMALTDYEDDQYLGRGAGSMFLQATGMTPYSGSISPVVPVTIFNLDDPALDFGGGLNPSIGSATTWNIAAATALVVPSIPCDHPGADSSCWGGRMDFGRSTAFMRTYGSTCDEPFGQTSVSRTITGFSKMLDMSFSSVASPHTAGIQEAYFACPGGTYDAEGNCFCWNGNPGSGYTCDESSGRPGDFMTHTISVKRLIYSDPGTCGGNPGRFPSVTREPYWVFYSPGAAGRVYVPDLPKDFPRACGGVDTVACATNQRMGLPKRNGSGAACGSCPTGESCQEFNGAKRCVVVAGSTFQIEDYEWRADFENVGLTDDLCRGHTPCTQDSGPVGKLDSQWATFDSQFDFGQVNACLKARSSNEMKVN